MEKVWRLRHYGQSHGSVGDALPSEDPHRGLRGLMRIGYKPSIYRLLNRLMDATRLTPPSYKGLEVPDLKAAIATHATKATVLFYGTDFYGTTFLSYDLHRFLRHHLPHGRSECHSFRCSLPSKQLRP